MRLQAGLRACKPAQRPAASPRRAATHPRRRAPPQMVHRALLAAGPALRAHAPLIGIVHRELFPAMAAAVSPCRAPPAQQRLPTPPCPRRAAGRASQAPPPRLTPPFEFESPRSQARAPSLGTINGICQVLLAVWQVAGPASMLQMEALLQGMLLRMADGGSPHCMRAHGGVGMSCMGGL